MVAALEGIRVLELTRVGPGAFCTRMLGDMGAEVIKIEQPEQKAIGEQGGMGLVRLAFDRNKKSLVLDLKRSGSQEVFRRLATTADVILEGFRPGVTKRLGLDYETISKVNPRIVYCSLSGYGQTGPYSTLPGHDINFISVTGLLDIIGERGGRPVVPLNLIADIASAALHGVIGILTAIIAREKTGHGQHVDVSYTDGVFHLLSSLPSVVAYLMGGEVPRRGESMLCGAYPYYNFYETKDGGYIALGCIEHKFWDNLCTALNRLDLAPYKSSQRHYLDAPSEDWNRVRRELEEIFRSKTRQEWIEFLSRYDVPVSKVNNIAEAFSDPQCLSRGILQELKDPELGTIRQIGMPIKYSDTPGCFQSPAPRRGQHTREILCSVGYNEEEIKDLI